MKIIVRAQLVTDWGEVTEVDVATFSRRAFGLNADTLGLSLADGKGARILATIFEAEFCDAQLRVSSGAESS